MPNSDKTELGPNVHYIPNFQVKPGDRVFVGAWLDPTDYHKGAVYMRNETTGGNRLLTSMFIHAPMGWGPLGASSAEWIVERPVVIQQNSELAIFDSILFQKALASTSDQDLVDPQSYPS